MRAADYTDDISGWLTRAQSYTNSDWERQFIADLDDKYTTYGEEMFLSEKQYKYLKKIALRFMYT